MSFRLYYAFMVCLLLSTQMTWSTGSSSLWSWIWPNRNVKFENYDSPITANLPTVQFEFNDNPDGFILESSKILGIELSDTDICQQRAIIALKESCSSLSDEDLGKFAMVLLNCQLLSENRKTFQCAPGAQLSECVSEMSSEYYNAYNNLYAMSKTICLTIRQTHFRGLAEITINRLMQSAQDQLSLLNSFKEKHGEMQQAALVSFDQISANHMSILQKHEELKIILDSHKAQTDENIEDILKEKELIQTGRNELNEFLTTLKHKYDQSLLIVDSQSKNTLQFFKDAVADLKNLHELVKSISNDLRDLSKVTEEHRSVINEKFAEICVELEHANAIIKTFSRSLATFKSELNWIKNWVNYLFSGENSIDDFILILCNSLYLLFGMICMTFANANSVSRYTFMAIVGVNLISVLCKFIKMDYPTLFVTNLVVFAAQIIAHFNSKYNWKQYLRVGKKSEANTVSFTKLELVNDTTIRTSNGLDSTHDVSSFPTNRLTLNPSRESLTSILGNSRRTQSRERSSESTVNDDDRPSERSRRSVSFYDDTVAIPSRCSALTLRGIQCRNSISEGSTNETCAVHERADRSRDR